MTPFRFGQKMAAQPSMLGDYMHQLNKFYNPWSKAWNEPATDGIEKALQYAGRAAMGVGAGAGLAAGGLAAAPAVTSGVASLGTAANTALAGAGTMGAGMMNRAQNMLANPRIGSSVNTGLRALTNGMNMYESKIKPVLEAGQMGPEDIAMSGMNYLNELRRPAPTAGAGANMLAHTPR